MAQFFGVMPNFILNLACDCVACLRVMGCTEAVYALKTVYSTYISCDSRTPSVLVIQVFEVYTGGQFGQFHAISLLVTNQQFAWKLEKDKNITLINLNRKR